VIVAGSTTIVDDYEGRDDRTRAQTCEHHGEVMLQRVVKGGLGTICPGQNSITMLIIAMLQRLQPLGSRLCWINNLFS